MTHFSRVALVAPLVLAGVVCLSPGPASEARQRAAEPPILNVLQSELRRNFEILRKDATPAYFIGYTVHDDQSTQIVASFGALDRTDESRGRFGTVEVRVGDYTLVMKDNHALKDWLPNEKRHVHIGLHGGISDDEMYVPLITLTA